DAGSVRASASGKFDNREHAPPTAIAIEAQRSLWEFAARASACLTPGFVFRSIENRDVFVQAYREVLVAGPEHKLRRQARAWPPALQTTNPQPQAKRHPLRHTALYCAPP